MNLTFRDHTGQTRTGTPIRAEGNNLIVQCTKGEGLLAEKETLMVTADRCDDPAEFWKLHRGMGGGPIYDEDGDVFE